MTLPEHASLQSAAGLVRLRIQLVYPEVVLLQAGMFLTMIWRGLDYAIPPNDAPASLSAIEQAAPFNVWGGLFLLGGTAGLLGLRWVRWPLTVFAHGLAVALYFAFALGSLVSIIVRAGHPPTLLAVAWIAALMGAAFITVGVVSWAWPQYQAAAWVGVAIAAVTSVVVIASASDVYGWRTATGWLFVLCVGHAVMASASSDAWKDYTGRGAAEIRRRGPQKEAITSGPQ
ncbi:minor tail protein [Gordonia phage Bizzy]|uniref:Minor tail protein n=2 Tax=Kroosvirus TaxID=2948789 RepID=A0A3G3M832_9CAUD|nr:minor tail protein [Gordonia phage Bizzy]YP_010002178.1 minor tail protein [Gordonia phage Ribeye]AXH44907.1 hypothetical protein SEA_RIBEYE_44 [Gordonia phage Ribeye]AYR02680.1 hypothetical protein SEA_BIZZY_44 [Gordonia phage Bizzy]URP21111.1 membrane protein [Gordonia phage Flatwoods]